MIFATDYSYTDRTTKAKYVWLKYGALLTQGLLDVGADAGYIKEYLGSHARYVGIGREATQDVLVDLEQGRLPFKDNSFSCVTCLDVLEHVDALHELCGELCRVSSRYLIISLPNPYSAFYLYLRDGDYSAGQHLKFYGLPAEKPVDRHKWFFSSDEAEHFVRAISQRHGFRILQMDREHEGAPRMHWAKKTALQFLMGKKEAGAVVNFVSGRDMHAGALWAVMEKDVPR